MASTNGDDSTGSSDGGESPARRPPEERKWAELPADVLSVIFKKIGAIDILMCAQRVCRPWRKLSLEPQIWRCVELTNHDYHTCTDVLEAMAREALKRSQGRMEEFAMEYVGDDDFLQYVADRASTLRCLHLISCYNVSAEGLAAVASKFPLLEEMEITFFSFGDKDISLIGEAYPLLKCFRFNKKGDPRSYYLDQEEDEDDYRDEVANAVANNMHELHQLQLVGNTLTNDGLLAILNHCPRLESLDIRACFNVKVDQSLRAKLARIKDLRLPNDPTDDYPYQAEISTYGSFDGDYLSGNSEIDMIYDDMFYDYYDYSEDEFDDLFQDLPY